MPIPIAKLVEAQRSTSDRILSFLRDHPNEAFTATEIYATLNNIDVRMFEVVSMMATRPSEALQRWTADLELLVKNGSVRSATIGGIAYYGIAP